MGGQGQYGSLMRNEAAEVNQSEYQFSKAAEILYRLGLMANWLAHVGYTHNAGSCKIRPTYSILPYTVRID
jgi:hypothetical protein